MNIVFIVTSFWAYGELLIAKEFAYDLKKNNNNILFIIPPSHKNSLGNSFKCVTFIPNSRNLNRILINEVNEKFKPNMVILSDFLNYSFSYRHYGTLIEDLNLFKCSIATFDNFNWNLKRKCMDTYGYVSDIPKKININYFGDRIIACPIGNPLLPNSEHEYRYSLFQSIKQNKDKKRKEIRQKLGISDNDKVILVSSAKWQENYVNEEKVDKFIELSNFIFNSFIERLGKKNIVYIVGGKKNDYSDNTNVRVLNSMPANEFDEYIKMSDLYIGRNITSTSMIRIALFGIPCVNIENSYSSFDCEKIKEISAFLNKDINISESDKVYKFKMFPVGWYDFLKPIFENNPYSEIIESCELFDVESTYNKIELLLYDSVKQKDMKVKLEKMNCVLKRLMSPTQIVHKILEK